MRKARPEALASRAILIALIAWVVACGGDEGPIERVIIPEGASLNAVSDSLAAHGVIGRPRWFRLYARLKGADSKIKAGNYDLRRGAGWSRALTALVEGHVVTIAVTIPEGWTVSQIAERVAPIIGVPADTVALRLISAELSDSLGSPGPTLEGYLFPETYRFAEGLATDRIAAELFDRYRGVWTPERRAARDSIGMDERQLITLASIIQAEARHEDEMPLISAVFHNRLRRPMRLQADPTVQYVLQSRQARLLFAHIDSVADNPYNTYTHDGLPPGPIGSPGLAAIDAALHPASVPYLYFVAKKDGYHEFSRTLREHNRAIQRFRQGN